MPSSIIGYIMFFLVMAVMAMDNTTEIHNKSADVYALRRRVQEMKRRLAKMRKYLNGTYDDRNKTSENTTSESISIDWDNIDFGIHFDKWFLLRRAPPSTVGQPWPLPQHFSSGSRFYELNRETFEFQIIDKSCKILKEALDRYKNHVFTSASQFASDNLQFLIQYGVIEGNDTKWNTAPVIQKISISINSDCSVYPTLGSDESYTISINTTDTYINANEVWGMLRGLETFTQLIVKYNGQYWVRETSIKDFPRFPYRGIMIDTARHYISKRVILQVLDGMVMNKFNVLHWHMVDDQSFPFQSRVFPKLSQKGAYHPLLIYTIADVKFIIEYARLRGIIVIPEFDTPGHTFSWGYGHPELLTQCYDRNRKVVPGMLGPMNPCQNYTYTFLTKLYREIMQVFPSDVLHFGGDEVPTDCWTSNDEVRSYAWNWLEMDVRFLENYFYYRLSKEVKDIANEMKRKVKFILWQEALKKDLQIPQTDLLINVWYGPPSDVASIAAQGYKVIYSSCWYLNTIEYGIQWPKYYLCDPTNTHRGFYGNDTNVIGGQACLWSEHISDDALSTHTWPRACAVAERLWSNRNVKNVKIAAGRLSEQRCRMKRRGIRVGSISGPDYCIEEAQDSKQDEEIFQFPFFFKSFHISKQSKTGLSVFSSCLTVLGILIFVLFIRIKWKAQTVLTCKSRN